MNWRRRSGRRLKGRFIAYSINVSITDYSPSHPLSLLLIPFHSFSLPSLHSLSLLYSFPPLSLIHYHYVYNLFFQFQDVSQISTNCYNLLKKVESLDTIEVNFFTCRAVAHWKFMCTVCICMYCMYLCVYYRSQYWKLWGDHWLDKHCLRW